MEFQERDEKIWVFRQSWEKDSLYRVWVAILSCCNRNKTQEVSILGRIKDAFGHDVGVVALHGSPYVLNEAFIEFLGNGYQKNSMEYPSYDLRLFRHCPQKTASGVFGNWDPYSLT